MFHFAAHGLRWSRLYADAEEACALWSRLTAGMPGLIAACVMPDHVHVLHARDGSTALRSVMSGYARWRNHRRGDTGPVWAALDPPERFPRGKLRTQIRYVHLNPCRARLVRDPLDWPLSTHRDAVGLTLAPVRRAVSDPSGLHAYVLGDPSVAIEGTELPWGVPHPLEIGRLADVVGGLARVPGGQLTRRGPARAVWLGAARAMGCGSAARLAEVVGVTRRSVFRTPCPDDPRVRLVCRVAHDPRFRSVEAMVRAGRR